MRKDNTLLRLLHERSEQALPELTKVYGGLCRTIAGNILSSREDVEETVSDAMLAVWNRVPPEQPENMRAYIGTITRNLSLTRLRHNTAAIRDDRVNISLSELECCLPSPDTPENRLEASIITDTINRYLATLPKVNRIIFIRRYYVCESCKEISRLTGLSELAVRSRLLRIREGLRKELEKEGISV